MRTCIPHRPAQWAFVLEHLSKIAEAHPAAAGWTADEMIGLVFGRIAGSPADVLPRGISVTFASLAVR
jgi:hypothetical protein